MSAFPWNHVQVRVNIPTPRATLLSPPIAAKDSLFLAPFPSGFPGGGKWENGAIVIRD